MRGIAHAPRQRLTREQQQMNTPQHDTDGSRSSYERTPSNQLQPDVPNCNYTSTPQPFQNLQSSYISHEARVGAVIYDMLVRGGSEFEALAAQLSMAYPTPAAVARHFATYTRCAIHRPSTLQEGGVTPSDQTESNFVLHRLNAYSVAWFCSILGSATASLRIWIIFILVLCATVANSSDNQSLYHFVEYVAGELVDEGPRRQLYRWLFSMVNYENQVVATNGSGSMGGATTSIVPDHVTLLLLFTPVIVGVLCFVVGGLSAICVNVVLRRTGGIRFDRREH